MAVVGRVEVRCEDEVVSTDEGVECEEMAMPRCLVSSPL